MLVPNKVRKCVVFLGVKKDGVFTPKATGFVVSINQGGLLFYQVATAQHCVVNLYHAGHEAVWLRFNKVSGGFEDIEAPYQDWHHHPDSANAIDVSVLPLPLNRDDVIFAHVPVDRIATAEAIQKNNIGVGDEIFISGLFRNHYGASRNVPIVRIGNIAAMPEEPVSTKLGPMDAYLIEAMSIGGLSGSPVFVHLPPLRVVDGEVRAVEGPQFFLLGLMHGHFDVRDLNDDVVHDDTPGSINTGIGVVIPAVKLHETIVQPSLISKREEVIAHFSEGSGATLDVANDTSA